MNAWRSTLAVLLVFAAGVATGGAGVHLWRLRAERRIFSSPEPVIQVVILALDRDLSLTEAQEAEVRSILLDARREVLEANPDVVPRMQALFEQTQERIGGVLSPEQRARYDDMVVERRRLLDEARKTTRSR